MTRASQPLRLAYGDPPPHLWHSPKMGRNGLYDLHSARAASSTASAWPLTFTGLQIWAILPSALTR